MLVQLQPRIHKVLDVVLQPCSPAARPHTRLRHVPSLTELRAGKALRAAAAAAAVQATGAPARGHS